MSNWQLFLVFSPLLLLRNPCTSPSSFPPLHLSTSAVNGEPKHVPDSTYYSPIIRRASNESPAYPYVNQFSAQQRRTEEYGSNNVLPLPPPTQPYADAVGLADDEEHLGGTSNNTFIYKLYRMLEDKSISAFIHWNDTGDSIVIPNIDQFKTNALGHHFEIPRRKASHQDQPIGEAADDSNSFPTSRSSGLSDTRSRIHHLEQENISLASQLEDTKGELGDVKEELSQVKEELSQMREELAALKKHLWRTEPTFQAPAKDVQAILSLHSAAPSGADNFMHKSPPSTLGSVAGVTHGGYLENAGPAGSADMAQPPTANWRPPGMGTRRIPSASQLPATGPQLPGTGLYSHTHCAPPTAALPPQNLGQSVQPSPPSSAARLAIDQDFLVSVTGAGQGWPGSCTGVPQSMLIDSGPSGGAFTLNGGTLGWGRITRGSPRQLNHPTMTVHRRQPAGSDGRDPGPSSSQMWPPRR
ncbi:hypothetical protein FRC01_002698 [Tulasnella sp. 417]|nr:hypothetical protein FRC01_002698 [Tulasnella sp. 417]